MAPGAQHQPNNKTAAVPASNTYSCCSSQRRPQRQPQPQQPAPPTNLEAESCEGVGLLDKHLDAALRHLGNGDECGVALLPVGVGQQHGEEGPRGGGHGVGAQGQSDAVQALLAKVKQVALACRVVAG